MWREVFGECYVVEGGAVAAKLCLERANPGGRYAVRYDCVQDLWRVYEWRESPGRPRQARKG